MRELNNKHVLFVIPYLANGGAQRALSNITLHFPEEWDIDILVNSDRYMSYPYRGNIISLEINEKPKTSSVLFQFKVFVKRAVKLYGLKRKKRYAACISFLDSANIANILSGKKYCKVIVSVRCSLIHPANSWQYRYIVNPLVKLLYNNSDKVVAVSKGVAKELVQYFHLQQSKVVAIENGYDVNEIRNLSLCKQGINKDILLANNGKKVIITSGRLSDQKGQGHLIRAFSRVCRQVQDSVLVILGMGPLEGYLKQLAVKNNIEDKVFFAGFTRNPFYHIAKADVFVLPSLYEGYPNSLAEAVCCGIPCIATDFQTGAREILAPQLFGKDNRIDHMVLSEYGILTPVCSGKKYSGGELLEEAEEVLADAMILLLQDKEKNAYYRTKSMERRRELGIGKVVRQWVELL